MLKVRQIDVEGSEHASSRLCRDTVRVVKQLSTPPPPGRNNRLRAGLVADRCLAKAPALARPAHVPAKASTAALPSETDGTGSTAIAALDNDTWLAPWTRGGGIGVGIGGSDFEAARAAAREAEENYLRAGIREGALAARRTEMSLRGDEAMVSIAPLLQKRYRPWCIVALTQAGHGREAAGTLETERCHLPRNHIPGLCLPVKWQSSQASPVFWDMCENTIFQCPWTFGWCL